MTINRDVLDKEIELIADATIKEWVKETLLKAPETYFKNAASSTGKYHPVCTFKEGGLIIHIKRAVYIANRLAEGWNIKGQNRDIVLAAVIIHDIAKVGQGQGCYKDYEDHPILAEKYFAPTKWAWDENIYEQIRDCVKNHMGPWSPKSIAKPLGKYTPLELLTYTADYIATTKEMGLPIDEISYNIYKET